MPAWFVPAIIWGGRALYMGYRARRAMQAAQVATRVIQSQAPGAAIAGATVLGGRAIVNEMANGDDAADRADAESLSTPIAGTCSTGNCGPPDCREISRKIQNSLNKLKQRYNEMQRDIFGMRDGRYVPGQGDWSGHIEAFNQRKRNLQKLVKKAKNMGCDVSPEAEEWLNQDPPE
mgnify:CR=1 FL=1